MRFLCQQSTNTQQMFKICLAPIAKQCASPLTYAWWSRIAGQNETEQQTAAEAAAAAGLLRPIRHLVSITDMAAGLSAVTGGMCHFLLMALGQLESPGHHAHDSPARACGIPKALSVDMRAAMCSTHVQLSCTDATCTLL